MKIDLNDPKCPKCNDNLQNVSFEEMFYDLCSQTRKHYGLSSTNIENLTNFLKTKCQKEKCKNKCPLKKLKI